MTREEVLKTLPNLSDFFQARADMAVGDGKLLLQRWADTATAAAELLKAQEPVKPRFRDMALCGEWQKVPFCGACGCTLGYSARYCPSCGKPIEWEDDDGKANQKG